MGRIVASVLVVSVPVLGLSITLEAPLEELQTHGIWLSSMLMIFGVTVFARASGESKKARQECLSGIHFHRGERQCDALKRSFVVRLLQIRNTL